MDLARSMLSAHLAVLLQNCAALPTARRGHAALLTAAAPSAFLHNNLISAYARCGSLGDARRVFDAMPHRNPVSYNALISAYARSPPHAAAALRLLRDMAAVDALRPNGSTFASAIRACTLLAGGRGGGGGAVHAQVVKFGFLFDLCLQTSLLSMYAELGDVESANRAFAEMEVKDDVAWNAALYANMNDGGDGVERGIELFRCMAGAGLAPTHFTFSIVLSGCGKSGALFYGKVVHGRVIVSGVLTDLPLLNSLVDMYSSCGDADAAMKTFRMIGSPDLVSWNSMIAGFSENGEVAMAMFVQLKNRSLEPPDDYSFAATISATGSLPSLEYGEPLHAQVRRVGYGGSVYVGSTLVGMYLKNEELGDARKLFDEMYCKDMVLFTELISGHSKHQEGEYAMRYFNRMREEGHSADGFALSSVVNAAADLAALKQGQVLHSLVVKAGYEGDMCVAGSLVDMYAKNGELGLARVLFDRTVRRDLKCWNALLGGFSHHGEAEQAFQLFNEMSQSNIRPDRVTFISLLSACIHRGLVQKGRFYWHYMTEIGLSPGIKHYSSMACLLGRAGMLEEAEDLIIRSPFSARCPELWRILLSSCVDYKVLDIGVRAAGRILHISSEDYPAHVLLTNLFAAVGKWDAVCEMRRKIRDLPTAKEPGLSWIEVGADVKVFLAGDDTHPVIELVRDQLQRLHENMNGELESELKNFTTRWTS